MARVAPHVSDALKLERRVIQLYRQLEEFGTVRRDVTTQSGAEERRIDRVIDVARGNETLRIAVHTPFPRHSLDRSDVTAAADMARGGSITYFVLIATNGWTERARVEAQGLDCNVRLHSIDSAAALLLVDNWQLCPSCQMACTVLDCDGLLPAGYRWSFWRGGRCHACGSPGIRCECGAYLTPCQARPSVCRCGHLWATHAGGTYVRPSSSRCWYRVIALD
jgi:hypothetical protein